jgi:hypothetical protein
MGIADEFDEMKDKVGKDKMDKGGDMADDKAEEMTGHKYDDKIDKGSDKLKDQFDEE